MVSFAFVFLPVNFVSTSPEQDQKTQATTTTTNLSWVLFGSVQKLKQGAITRAEQCNLQKLITIASQMLILGETLVLNFI